MHSAELTRLGFTEDQQSQLAQMAPQKTRQELLRHAPKLAASGYLADHWVSFLLQRGSGGFAASLFKHAQVLNRAGFTDDELYRFLWANFANDRLLALARDRDLRDDMSEIERKQLMARHAGNR